MAVVVAMLVATNAIAFWVEFTQAKKLREQRWLLTYTKGEMELFKSKAELLAKQAERLRPCGNCHHPRFSHVGINTTCDVGAFHCPEFKQ